MVSEGRPDAASPEAESRGDTAPSDDHPSQDEDPELWAARLAQAEGSADGSLGRQFSSPSVKYGIIFGGALLVIVVLMLLIWFLSLFVD